MPNEFEYSEIYKMYAERLKTEGDWIWSRFQIYMTLNTAAFAAIGLIFGNMKLDFSAEDLVRLAIIVATSILGRQLAIEWTNVNRDGRFWQNVFTWHAAQIERKLQRDAVDLYQYIDSFEMPSKSETYVGKSGMEHIVDQMKNQRKDPILSNLSVSRFFKVAFEASFFVSFLAIGSRVIMLFGCFG